MSVRTTVIFATRKPWVPPRASIVRWVRAALGPRRAMTELSVRVVGKAESQRLNHRYRRRNRPTNVLSFPATVRQAEGWRQLGDLVVCAPVVAAEARELHKSRAAHWAHMIVHGSLHLLGHDHEQRAAAEKMERRERRVLAALGFDDPYEEPR